MIEDMKEEEGTPQAVVKKIILLKRSQGTPKFESNVVNKSEYILISSLTISSPQDSWDIWLVESVATHRFSTTRKSSLIW